MKIKRNIKNIFVVMLVLLIVFEKFTIISLANNDDELMIWTNKSRELYDYSYGSQVFGATEEEAIKIYDTIKGYVDLSEYDDYIIYAYKGGYASEDTCITIACFKGKNDLRAIYSDYYYSGSTLGTRGFLNLMIEGTYVDEIYMTRFDYVDGVGANYVEYIEQKKEVPDITFSSGINGYINESATNMSNVGTVLFSTIPVYIGYEYQQSVGGELNTHTYNVPDIANYCNDYSQNAYGYNGEGVVEYNASSGSGYMRNNELCFDTFLVEKINHPNVLGGTGVRISYSYGDKLFKAIQEDYDYSMKMHYSIVLNYRYTVFDDGVINANSKSYYTTVSTQIEDEIVLHTKQNGSYLLDLGNIIDDENYPVLYCYLYGIDNSMVDGWGARATYNFLSSLTFIDSNTIHSAFNLGVGDDYTVDFVDIDVTGFVYDYGDNEQVVMSNSGQGNVELLSGRNSSYVNTYDNTTGESVKNDDTVVSGNNYYNVVTETDSNGNTYYNYYYYNTENNTITPSINNSVSEILLSFANPLVLEGVNISASSNSSGGSGGGSTVDNIEITIEDDDYTDSALREDLKDGFGLFDDSDTDLKADGYLQLASDFFNNIDPSLGAILCFGISSSVVIGILRTALRR